MDARKYIVYKHTSPSNKVYIGITSKTLEERSGSRGWQYRKCKGTLISKAIIKYGWNNFRHEVLLANLTQEEASEMERYFIALYKSNNREYGYNLTSGGEIGFVQSDSVKAIISQKAKQQWQDPIIRAKMIERLKISHKGILTDKQKAVYKAKKEKTDKRKLILRFAKIIKKRITPPKHLTDERKKLISIATKKGMNNPIVKAKLIENHKKQKGKRFKNYVAQYDLNNYLIKVHKGVANASRELNISPMSIHNCLKNKTKTGGGFVWKIATKEEIENGFV